jgi:predicted DNA-binding transcriptional regulator YafY
LAQKLETRPKTVYRYLNILSDTFGVDPLYDKTRHGYYYPDSDEGTPVPRLTEDEMSAVFLLEQAARAIKATPLEPVIDSILAKLSLMQPKHASISFREFSATLSLRPHKEAVPDLAEADVLNILYKAISQSQQVLVVYEGRQRVSRTKRTLDPLHLARCEGQWYLVAWCHLRKKLRVFVPSRIKDIKPTKQGFTAPSDFDPDSYFRNAFGIIAGGEVKAVILNFSALVAPIIRERVWHATQEMEDISNGGVRLRMVCSQSDELLAWLMSWGSEVDIEEPESLARAICLRHKDACDGGKRGGTDGL